MVAADGNGIVTRHVLGTVGDNVGDDPHGGAGGINVGIARQKFLEDVVLDGAGQQFPLDALLLGSHDIPGQNGQHGAVHGHGHGNFFQGNLVEKNLHVFDGVNRHAGFADVARDAGMVGVIAPVGGQVKGHGQAGLSRGKVFPVELVRFPGGGKSRVLTDGPGLVGVHGGRWPAQVRGLTRQRIDGIQAFQIFGGIDRFDDNAFRRFPVKGFEGSSLQFPDCRFFPFFHLRVLGHHKLLL